MLNTQNYISKVQTYLKDTKGNKGTKPITKEDLRKMSVPVTKMMNYLQVFDSKQVLIFLRTQLNYQQITLKDYRRYQEYLKLHKDCLYEIYVIRLGVLHYRKPLQYLTLEQLRRDY